MVFCCFLLFCILEKKRSVVICIGECTCTKILSWIFCCCHARRGCGSESCDVQMAPVNAARKDLSNECRVQWVLTKPRGSGASQARHHRKERHPGAMALLTANLNGQGRKKRPKSKVKLTGKGKQNQKCTKKQSHIAEPNQGPHARARAPFPARQKGCDWLRRRPTNSLYRLL